jgi:MFS family permease
MDRQMSASSVHSRTPSIFEKPSYLGVLPVVFLYFLVVMGLSPLTDQIIIDVVCDDLKESDCGSTDVAAASANLSFSANMALYGPAVLLCGFYGSLADRLGRKAVMCVTIVGLLLDVALQFYVSQYKPASYEVLIVLANFLYGICGGFVTFIMSSMCYVSDATIAVPHSRHTAYSYTETAIFAPQIIGPVATGFWAAAYGYGMPLLASFGLLVLTLVYVQFLPESLPPDAECRLRPLGVDLLKTFKNMAFLFTYKAPEGRSPIPHVAGAFSLYFICAMGATALRVVYFKHAFDFDASQIGVYAGTEGLVACLSMIFAPSALERLTGDKLELITVIKIGYVFRYACRC